MEDVDITPEQIKDIVDLLEKESKLRKTSTEQSNSVAERTEWYKQHVPYTSVFIDFYFNIFFLSTALIVQS